jgi:hypothetical protein
MKIKQLFAGLFGQAVILWVMAGCILTVVIRGYSQAPNEFGTDQDQMSAAGISQTSIPPEAPLGSVTVEIGPLEAVAAGAQWKLHTDTDTVWRDSGTYTNLPIGIYTLEFKPIPGWTAPQQSRPVPVTRTGRSYLGSTYSKNADYTIDLSFTNATVDMDFYPNNLPPPEGYYRGMFVTNALTTHSQGPAEYRLPVPNSNTWARLVAVPQTVYQFTGWNVEREHHRNPESSDCPHG